MPDETPAPRAPLPPFDEAGARQKVQAAEDAWNSLDPVRVAGAYTPDSVWRNRSEFVTGRDEIVAFLTRKWEREQGYALRKSLWAYEGNHIAVRFQYEWHDAEGQWWRSSGNEKWECDDRGSCAAQPSCRQPIAIAEADRRIFGARGDDERGVDIPLA